MDCRENQGNQRTYCEGIGTRDPENFSSTEGVQCGIDSSQKQKQEQILMKEQFDHDIQRQREQLTTSYEAQIVKHKCFIAHIVIAWAEEPTATGKNV